MVAVEVKVGVAVCVKVGVWDWVKVGVAVCVKVGVSVCVNVDVEVGVLVVVRVGVAVAAETVWVFPVIVPPVTIAVCPVIRPLAVIPPTDRLLEKVLGVRPDILRSNTSKNVCGAPDTSGAVIPFAFMNVTEPVALKPPALTINKEAVPLL